MEIKDVDMAQKIHALRTELAAARAEIAALRATVKLAVKAISESGDYNDGVAAAVHLLDAMVKAKGGDT